MRGLFFTSGTETDKNGVKEKAATHSRVDGKEDFFLWIVILQSIIKPHETFQKLARQKI
jgi:hypothetical protein